MKISLVRFGMLNKRQATRKEVGDRWKNSLMKQVWRTLLGGRLADLPPPPVSVNPDYVQCPHCGRNYAPGVAERHIPKCVNIQNKPKPPPNMGRTAAQPRMGGGGGGGGASNGRTPVTNYGSASGGFGNSNAHPPPNRSGRGGRYWEQQRFLYKISLWPFGFHKIFVDFLLTSLSITWVSIGNEFLFFSVASIAQFSHFDHSLVSAN